MGIMQEIKIWPNGQMAYALIRIRSKEWGTKNSPEIWVGWLFCFTVYQPFSDHLTLIQSFEIQTDHLIPDTKQDLELIRGRCPRGVMVKAMESY